MPSITTESVGSSPARKRAGLVTNASQYRFGSLGRWAQRGRYPLETHAIQALLPALGPLLGVSTLNALCRRLRGERAAEAAGNAPAETGFSLTARRRMRFWVDGVVIGSELFVRGIMSGTRRAAEARRHRLARSRPGPSTQALYSWRRLRVAVN